MNTLFIFLNNLKNSSCEDDCDHHSNQITKLQCQLTCSTACSPTTAAITTTIALTTTIATTTTVVTCYDLCSNNCHSIDEFILRTNGITTVITTTTQAANELCVINCDENCESFIDQAEKYSRIVDYYDNCLMITVMSTTPMVTTTTAMATTTTISELDACYDTCDFTCASEESDFAKLCEMTIPTQLQ